MGWGRYKADGDDEGFATYVADELAEIWDRMATATTSGSRVEGGLQFMEEDDSQHSSHPMMDSSGKLTSIGSRSQENKKSRSRLSGLEASSASNKSTLYSKLPRTKIGSASSKRAAGYTSANVEDI